MSVRIFCIINDHAGTAGESAIRLVTERFGVNGYSPEIVIPRAGDNIEALAKDAINRKFDIVVAGGGDGTVNAVASALVGKGAVRLGVIPMGTLNHFARDAAIPTDLNLAVDNIITGEVKAVDVGSVNGQIFLNNSSVGLYPAIVKLREGLQRSGYAKWTAATLATIRIMSRFRRLHLELQTSSGSPLQRRAALLFIGNNAYETNLLQLGKRLQLDQGKLWITMPKSASPWRLLMALLSEILGQTNEQEVYRTTATELLVTSGLNQLQVAIDGEVHYLKPPLKYNTLPKALRVIVPKPTEDVA